MNPRKQARRGERGRAHFRSPTLALGLAVLLLLLGLPTLLYPYGRDQAMFAYVGGVWRSGGLPYRDAWDVKLPGIYAVYALAGGVEWGPRLLDLAAAGLVVAGLVALGRLAQRQGTPAEALGGLAGGIALVYTLGAFDYWNLAQAETLIAPLATLAVLAALRGRPFAAGLLAGLAATLKTTAVLTLLPVLAASWGQGPGARSQGAAANGENIRNRDRGRETEGGRTRNERLGTSNWVPLAGWLLPLALFALYFAARGALPYLGELLAAQAEYAGGDPRLAGRGPLEVVRVLQLTGYVALLPASALALVPWLRDPRPDQRTRLVIAVWWAAGLAQVVVQRRFYLYHWAVFTPPAAWLAAYGACRLWDTGRKRGPVLRALLLAVGAVLAFLALAPRAERAGAALRVLTGQQSLLQFRGGFAGVFHYRVGGPLDAAAHVRARSRPGDRLLVVGFEPEVYLYSGRRAPSRHASDAPLFDETSIREARRRRWFAELMRDLERAPPLYLVMRDREQPGGYPPWSAPLARFRERCYAHEADYGRFHVYRRRGY